MNFYSGCLMSLFFFFFAPSGASGQTKNLIVRSVD